MRFPFQIAGGDIGLRLFMALQFATLFVGLGVLVRRWLSWKEADNRVGVYASLVLYGCFLSSLSFWWTGLAHYSHDTLGSALIFGGAALLVRHPLLAGGLMGLATGCRVTHVLFIPVFILLFSVPWSTRVIFRAGVGAMLATGLVVATNLWIYGHWAGGYATAPFYIAGQIKPSLDTHYFSFEILRDRGWERLVTDSSSIMRSFPGVVPALGLVMWAAVFRSHLWRGGDWRWSVAVIVSLAAMLWFCSFSYWERSGGARFVMIPAALLMLAGARVVGELQSRPKSIP